MKCYFNPEAAKAPPVVTPVVGQAWRPAGSGPHSINLRIDDTQGRRAVYGDGYGPLGVFYSVNLFTGEIGHTAISSVGIVLIESATFTDKKSNS